MPTLINFYIHRQKECVCRFHPPLEQNTVSLIWQHPLQIACKSNALVASITQDSALVSSITQTSALLASFTQSNALVPCITQISVLVPYITQSSVLISLHYKE